MNPVNENIAPNNIVREKKQLMLAPPVDTRAVDGVLMSCGDFSVFIPSSDVVSLVSTRQLVAQPQTPYDCGYLEFNQEYYSIFCFKKSLQLQPTIAASHTTIVLLNDRNCLFGICCHELVKQTTAGLKIYSVPPSMRSRKQPFAEFTIIDHCAVGLSSAASLSALLRLRGATLATQPNAISVLEGAC